ncbi:MAG: PD-(D/E)XK nuclease family protein [Prevotella sp.]
MESYISLVAADLLRRFGNDLSRVAVVFPNKRASLFLNQELSRLSGGNIWSPSYITISDLFRRHSPLTVADQILLVCRLYRVFIDVTGYAGETLDQFYGWGVTLLADFDDIDKNMAEAGKVFKIVTDLHELDDISYLDDGQRDALRHFFSAFTDDKPSEMREKFMRLWKRLYDIYTMFRESLRRDGLAYEGMLYRDVAEDESIDFGRETYCFVGFNMLHTVERRVFSRLYSMPDGGEGCHPHALFYWDYDDYYMKAGHEAGHFISSYLAQYPDALVSCGRETHDNFKNTDITYVSSPTENLQARYVHDWLMENERWKDGQRTAIVMADETLLQAIIRSLPDEVGAVNITTGYPLAQSSAVSLLQYLITLQTAGHVSGTTSYRLRHVLDVLRHPYIARMSETVTSLIGHLQSANNYYPSRKSLSADASLTTIFSDLSSYPQAEESGGRVPLNARLALWLEDVLAAVSRREDSLSPLDIESIYRIYQTLERLFALVSDNTLDVDTSTFTRLLFQIISSSTVPYHGEPVEGVQIMGVLETRCLDFDHVLLLSSNEGNMPKGVNDASFIPHSVRRAHGLTTIEHKVGIYSYYFHRLLQRAGDATIAYNSSAEGMNTGEMSRFMLQVMVEREKPVRRIALTTGQTTTMSSPRPVMKDGMVMGQLTDMITNKEISPTSLGTYLRCQVMYYYQHVARLREPDRNDIDEIDNRTFGNIFHAAAEKIYKHISDNRDTVSAPAIKAAMADPSLIGRCVDEAFRTELFHIGEGEQTMSPRYSGLQIINRRVIIRLLHNLLCHDLKQAPITILGTERKVTHTFTFRLNGQDMNVKMGGYIDRLDMAGGRVRVIDYKTGNRQQKELKTTADIFDSSKIESHTDYYLQTLLYAAIVSADDSLNPKRLPVTPQLFFVQKMASEGFSPSLVIGGEEIDDVRLVAAEYLEGIEGLLADIMNPELPFSPTNRVQTCLTCPLSQICHT